MAQIFANTTINSATPARAISAWLIDRLLDAGWVFVEETGRIAIETGTMTGCITASATPTTITRSGGTYWSSGSLSSASYIRITSGAGASPIGIPITGNTTTTITVASWPNGQPDSTSVFDIIYPHKILKSPGTLNNVGVDFYILIGTSSANIGIFEEYSPVTHIARKYAPTGSAAAIVVDPTDNTVTNPSGVDLSASTTGLFLPYIQSRTSTATRYFLDADVNGFLIGSSDIPAFSPIEVGVFQSLLPVSIDPVPLVAFSYQASSSSTYSTGKTTREPGAPASGLYNFAVQSPYGGSSGMDRKYAFSTFEQETRLLGVNPSLYRGMTAARIVIASSRGWDSSYVSTRGVLRGVTSYCGGALGDTMTVTTCSGEVRTYVLCQVANTGALHTFVRTS